MSGKREGKAPREDDEPEEERERARQEADVVRLEAEALPSGLFRHRLRKLIMELPGRRARAQRNRDGQDR